MSPKAGNDFLMPPVSATTPGLATRALVAPISTNAGASDAGAQVAQTAPLDGNDADGFLGLAANHGAGPSDVLFPHFAPDSQADGVQAVTNRDSSTDTDSGVQAALVSLGILRHADVVAPLAIAANVFSFNDPDFSTDAIADELDTARAIHAAQSTNVAVLVLEALIHSTEHSNAAGQGNWTSHMSFFNAPVQVTPAMNSPELIYPNLGQSTAGLGSQNSLEGHQSANSVAPQCAADLAGADNGVGNDELSHWTAANTTAASPPVCASGVETTAVSEPNRGALLSSSIVDLALVDQAFAAMVNEIASIRSGIVNCFDEFSLPTWAIAAASVGACGAGGWWIWHHRGCRSRRDEVEDEVVSWLFAQLYGPIGQS